MRLSDEEQAMLAGAQGPAVAWAMFSQEQVQLTGELKRYASSAEAERSFCPNCGSQIAFTASFLPGLIDLTVGSLDEPSVLHPVSHFAVESRIENWHADDGLPGDRLDTSEKLNARWKASYGDDVVPGVDAVRGKS